MNWDGEYATFCVEQLQKSDLLFLLKDAGSSAVTDCEVALHKQVHSFITIEINLNVYRSQFLFFFLNLCIAFQWQKIAQIWWKMCTHSIFYASVIWEPSDEHKLGKYMVKASFIKAKIITKQSALKDLKHNFHLLHILHFSPLSFSVPGSPHLGTIIRLISR